MLVPVERPVAVEQFPGPRVPLGTWSPATSKGQDRQDTRQRQDRDRTDRIDINKHPLLMC